MIFSRCLLLFVGLMLTGLPDGAFAAERSHGMVTKAEQSLRGTWYSAAGAITFKDNGTIFYKGKRYFYAVSNGGVIQLSGEHSMTAMIQYQLVGDKLTLMENGTVAVYARKR